MTYIQRRIQVLKANGTTEIVPDHEFASVDAPLVLLGEPGAGKSDTASEIARLKNSTVLEAYKAASDAPLHCIDKAYPVIDGLDEVQISSNDQPLSVILRRLEENQSRSFLITCRAVDWSNIRNERSVENWFGIKPVVGYLEPLDDEEITRMVDSLEIYPDKGDQFVKQAKANYIIDFARNPQSLILLLKAIAEAGWPKTKANLFGLACVKMAKEHNPFHQSLKSDRPTIDEVLSAAGFICTQILLSAKHGINVDGRDNVKFPRPVELASDSIPISNINAALSSLLFRPVGADGLTYAHRTVAEYLGARWLTSALQKGELSTRRLEQLLHRDNIVPGPLRGLHAWLATLERNLTYQFVERDPYGCYRYGDVAQYSIDQAGHLILQLQDLATIDPHFRSQDWEAQVGTGLSRPELRKEIVELIRNSEVPYQLSTVVLESLQGTELSTLIREDLRHVVLNESMSYVTRDRALDALAHDNSDEDWRELALSLSDLGSHSSTRIAGEIVVDNVDLFTGREIAEIVINYDKANAEEAVRLSTGLDYRLIPVMGLDQLKQSITVFQSELPDSRHNWNDYERKIGKRFIDVLQAYLQGRGQSNSEELYSWLRSVPHSGYYVRDWKAFTVRYFSDKPEIRQEIQSMVFDRIDPEERRIIDFHLREMGHGLVVTESDAVYLLERLIAQENSLDDFEQRWACLMQLILTAHEFRGEAEMTMREQANSRPRLQSILAEYENRLPPEWERDEELRRRQAEIEEHQRTATRYQRFSRNENEIRLGQHLQSLHQIAIAYLGLYGEVSDIEDPVSRIEWLVGPENVESALTGLAATCRREDIPEPREITRLQTEEDKEYFLKKIGFVTVSC